MMRKSAREQKEYFMEGHNIRRLRRSFVKGRMPCGGLFNNILLFYLILGKLDLVHLGPV